MDLEAPRDEVLTQKDQANTCVSTAWLRLSQRWLRQSARSGPKSYRRMQNTKSQPPQRTLHSSVYEQVTARIVELLKTGTVPWRKP